MTFSCSLTRCYGSIKNASMKDPETPAMKMRMKECEVSTEIFIVRTQVGPKLRLFFAAGWLKDAGKGSVSKGLS